MLWFPPRLVGLSCSLVALDRMDTLPSTSLDLPWSQELGLVLSEPLPTNIVAIIPSGIIFDRDVQFIQSQVKTLAQDTIIANARFFGGNVDLVPKQVQGGFLILYLWNMTTRHWLWVWALWWMPRKFLFSSLGQTRHLLSTRFWFDKYIVICTRFWCIVLVCLTTFQAIEEGVCHMWTVSAFQQHPNTMIIVDEVGITLGIFLSKGHLVP